MAGSLQSPAFAGHVSASDGTVLLWAEAGKRVWNFVGSRIFRPIFRPLEFLEGWKLRRIKREMLYAAKHGLTYHLWWHPHNIGVETVQHLAQLEEIFAYYMELKERYGMESRNMSEMVAILEGENA